ncbi:ATPase domain of HSP90 chaperone/DNA topoisomerase II/histidine kinase [Sistotremastrum suecicum HHB10207 ss-3]|uniref:ATPase domain of HSP90 chaperone/DNA topoisomerase II/histidine kinase n=1 Tax=Sistotremastrum suecicum HHB10207 ss-3 TaxID=1314776 RepID=A0A166AQJ2_9AGAM|nr:ATPase domain of HSP90 chaperone/DNA topoisomerase II/histidine kinase [Sistotremastrum suecicum HHB10207 ss-3]
MPEILLLPEKTRTRLRSTQIITSLPQLISELLQNALDAGAKHVDISIDCDEWTCTVRDDGVGIPRDGLKLLAAGGEGGRYGTSKAYNERSLEDISTFGFRGEALASVADISCLEISSRTAGAKESWSVIVKGGKELYVGPAIRWRRESPGTTVCIRDAFYNLPIRRTSHTAPARTVELVKKEIEVYALMFPGVTFSVETANKSKETHGKNRILTILPTGSTLLTFKSIYGGALIEHVHEINAEDRGMVLKGFISLVGAPSKVRALPSFPCQH